MSNFALLIYTQLFFLLSIELIVSLECPSIVDSRLYYINPTLIFSLKRFLPTRSAITSARGI